MTFDPWWIILVPAVLLLGVTLVWAVSTWPQASGASRTVVLARVVLAVAAVAIGAHPVQSIHVTVPGRSLTDVVLVIDRTTSMGARDAQDGAPRMDAVTADLTQLVEDVAGARVAVLVFDDDARVAVPFTTDASAVTSHLRTIGWRPSTKAAGSDVSVAVPLVERLLRQSRAEHPTHERHLIYAGDGEQTADHPPATFEPVGDLVDGGAVLGYGTTRGATMTTSTDSDALVEIDGEPAISRIDEPALRTIASELGVEYERRGGGGALTTRVPARTAAAVAELRPGGEYYWIIALGAGVVLVPVLWVAVARLRAVREEVTDGSR